jgi:DNA polymerase-4
LDRIAANLWTRIEKAQAWGRTVVLKVKFADFRIITRSRSFSAPVRSPELLAQAGRELLLAQLPLRMGARLLGLGVHNLEGEEEGGEPGAQLALEL